MKVLKRTFNMTKEEVEFNIKIMSYHRKYISAMSRMIDIRNDQALNRDVRRAMMKDIRNSLIVEWKATNERISSDN